MEGGDLLKIIRLLLLQHHRWEQAISLGGPADLSKYLKNNCSPEDGDLDAYILYSRVRSCSSTNLDPYADPIVSCKSICISVVVAIDPVDQVKAASRADTYPYAVDPLFFIIN